ncbi:hypothetical protein [Nostoc sp.]|uniref:hypothetical protein n=1 Tax=Nostoc sp. TaxID=1180 RepID=UPI002FF4C1B2
MKKLFALIEKESAKFAQLPFFKFLGNKSIDVIQRLSFAPCFALFVMGYGDLNKFVCLEQPTVNPIPDVVNNQIREEENHGIWVLKNLEDLNFNLFLNITDSLKINFSDQTGIFRQIIYELYRRTFQVNPIYKLVAIESIESISNIFLSITAPITQKLKFLTNREYTYFRNPHLLAENDHNVHSHQRKKFIASMPLAEDICKQAGELVIEEEFRIQKRSRSRAKAPVRINQWEIQTRHFLVDNQIFNLVGVQKRRLFIRHSYRIQN